MEKGKVLKIWEASLLFALSFCLCLGTWAAARQSSISSSLVRLHVLAHSDSPEEQALKLRVRDAVLAYISHKLDGADTVAEARGILESEMQGIALAASSASEGRQVQVSLGEECYPTRDYEGFSLPAGSYESLRISIGEGAGQNWWCIVFPPVCLSAVQSEPVAEAMNKQDYALVSSQEGWEWRFRSVELWGELMEIID